MISMTAKYKASELGTIPEEWNVCRLDSLGSGGRPAIKAGPFGSTLTKDNYVKSGYKIYGQEQVIRGDCLYGDYYVSKVKFNSLRSCEVVPGDVLLSLVGTVGRLLVVPCDAPPGIINPRLIRFALDRSRVDPYYFSALLESSDYQEYLSRHSQGGIMGVLSAGILRPVRIALPPLPEQRAIATALSDADALIAALDRLIAKKRAIKQGAMQRLLTGEVRLEGFDDPWQPTALGDIADILKGSGLSKDQVAPYGARLCILYGELFTTYGPIISSVVSRTNSAEGLISKRGDVLMPGSTTTEGADLATASALLLEEVALGGDINVIRIRARTCDPSFLAIYLQVVRRDQIAILSQGITIHHLYGRDLRKLELMLPSLSEQSSIATVLSDMDAEIAALERQQDKTRALKQGMMQDLLTGRVRLV